MSVVEVRYCAMGERCTQAHRLGGKPVKLRSTNREPLCEICVQAGHTLEDGVASRSESQEIRKRCPSCGEEFGTHRNGRDIEVGAKLKFQDDYELLCARCVSAWRSGVEPGFRFPTKEDSPVPQPEVFDELFRAGGVLLEENAEEDQTIPTLALAYLVGQGVPRLVAEKERFVKLEGENQAWRKEAERFARRYGGLRPMQVARGTLILERLPVFIAIAYDDAHEKPEEVIISVYPHRSMPAKAEEVATQYDKRLSDVGISHDEQRAGHLSFDFQSRSLVIRIQPGKSVKATTVTEGFTVPQLGWRIDRSAFPHPQTVQDFYTPLRKTFAQDLAVRSAGRRSGAKHLVPACVAFFLREYGIPPRKEINRLVNKHKLGEVQGPSSENHLWENVNNESLVSDPLIDAAWTLFYEGHE